MKHLTPPLLALLALLAGCGMAVSGVYLLAGTGWALLAGACPLLLFALIILRGLKRAQQNPQ
ncbi:MAG: hypothetical protein Q8N13_10490 [Acidovorax sp.]|nr:hypothetical protein [Acidovorax sp.]